MAVGVSKGGKVVRRQKTNTSQSKHNNKSIDNKIYCSTDSRQHTVSAWKHHQKENYYPQGGVNKLFTDKTPTCF